MGGEVVGDIAVKGKGGRLLYDSAAGTPLSISMPLTHRRHRGEALIPWLRNLLPDRDTVLMQWRRTFGVQSLSPIELLRHVGEEVAGAAQFVRQDRLTAATTWQPARPVSDTEIGDMLRRSVAAIPESASDSDTGRFSLAGMQAKIALQRLDDGRWALPEGTNPTTHILKPAIANLQDQHVNEYLTMTAARLAGLAVAATEVAVIDGVAVVIVERYDRFRAAGRWARAHQEDLLQVLGQHPEHKYENQGGPDVRTVAHAIRQATGVQCDVQAFVSALVFHWLTISTDAHAKNYSLLLSGDAARLAPLYDLNSYLYYGAGVPTDMSMRIGTEFRADRVAWSDWVSLARDVQVDQDWLADEIRRQATVLPDAFSDAARNLDGTDVVTSDLPQRLVGYLDQWTQAALRQTKLSAASTKTRGVTRNGDASGIGRAPRAIPASGQFTKRVHGESDLTLP